MNGITFNIADLKEYASKEELQSYATIQYLDDYAQKSELTDYAQKSELVDYAQKSELSDYAQKSELADYASKTDLNDYASKSELDNYASKTDLDSYTTTTSFDAHVNSSTNPHSVTKSQVGLGNVPNVATNDQTPTYNSASSLTSLTSGETLSTAFGKIAKAISDFISHIANKSNPHDVTVSQIGAAASTHTHSASDITSGYFTIDRGGIGRTTKTVSSLDYEFRAIKLQSTIPTSIDTGCIVLVYDTGNNV